ncbi:MAG: hypothetical protein ACI8RY_000103 [Urechidicola sp.]|jgi:hypothetical protein
MRLIALSFLLFTFSCTSSPVPFSLDDIKVTQAEITEVVESEEESEHMLPHLRDMDFSNSFMSQEGFDKIEELIAYSIKLEKAEIKIKNLNNYKEIFLLKIEDAIFLSENLKGEISSIFIECLQPLTFLIDLTFDTNKIDDFNQNLFITKVYLGNLYNLFPKLDD